MNKYRNYFNLSIHEIIRVIFQMLRLDMNYMLWAENNIL